MIAAHVHYVISTAVAVGSLAFADRINNIWQNASKEKITGCLLLDMNVLYAEN